jgi:hypothetical protein
VAGATSYNLYYFKFDNSLYSQVYPVPGVTSPYSGPYALELPIINTSNENPLAYFFFVTAVNANGESYPSFEVTATPSNPPPPAAPVLETPVLVGTNVTLNWNVVPSATYYIVYAGTAKGVTKATGAPSTVTVPTATATFTAGTYYIVVTAVNDNGTTTDTGDDLESTESNEIKVTVP